MKIFFTESNCASEGFPIEFVNKPNFTLTYCMFGFDSSFSHSSI